MALRAWNLNDWPAEKIEDFLMTFISKGLGLKTQKSK
jgi:hypothetical protein